MQKLDTWEFKICQPDSDPRGDKFGTYEGITLFINMMVDFYVLIVRGPISGPIGNEGSLTEYYFFCGQRPLHCQVEPCRACRPCEGSHGT